MADGVDGSLVQRIHGRIPWRLVIVFAMAFAGLAGLTGDKAAKPSKDNHFVHLASAWLDGRLAHDGPPPGFCDPESRRARKCKHHTFDDWAAITTLTFEGGRRVRAFPCRTTACTDAARATGKVTWFVLGDGWTEFDRAELRRADRQVQWYVSFPPGPALLLLPFVALFGLATLDVLLTVIFASAIPVVLVAFLDRERGTENGRGTQHLLAALAWTFATPACFLAANGRVWFTAQICGALMLMIFVANVWRMRRPQLAGLALGVAVACRPTLGLAVVLFVVPWWQAGRRWRVLTAFAWPLIAVGGALVWLNLARFDMPFEFGHRFLDIRWQARIQEYGLFSARYLPRNLRCLFTLLPQAAPAFPYFKVSIHGTALWLSTPWILLGLVHRERFEHRGVLWLTALAVGVVPLFYQNSGQLQFTYRFAVDWLPLVVVALVFGGAFRQRKLLVPLLGWALLFQCYGAWRFSHKPGKAFVAKPLGWPFEAELKP